MLLKTNSFDLLFDDLITDFFKPTSSSYIRNHFGNYGRHSYDEESKTYTINLALPGFSKNDIEISYEDNELIIKGNCEKNDKMSWQSSINQSYLIEELDEDSIDAKLENGILTISYKKKPEEKKKSKLIKIS